MLGLTASDRLRYHGYVLVICVFILCNNGREESVRYFEFAPDDLSSIR